MQAKIITSLLSILFLPLFIFSQPLNTDYFKTLKPRNIGPAGMSGRVTAIDVVLNDPDVIYIGTASGGVWRSTSGGIDWDPIFDEAPVQSIGSVRINQNNPDEIWVGTGEGNPRNSQNSGNGIYKSIDGGKNWKRMGLADSRTIHRIIIHRDDPNTVFAGVTGSAWGPNEQRGVFKTTDGGKTWNKVLYVNEETGCADLVVDPSNPNKLIAAMWEYGRKPWTFNSGGPGSGIYVTFDGGNTWEKRTEKDGLPKGDLGRIGLAIAPSSPKIVYALVEAKENALYKSTDGGFKWKKMLVDDQNSALGNRPFYYSEIYVDPKNENRVYSIWSVMSKSEDGGKNFERWVGWDIHPDHHALWISPDDPDYMINGNDGGLNISHDRGESWRFVENLPLAQFYHIDYDMSIPYRVGGGMQDNGSWVGPSSVWKNGGIRNSDWQEIYFGDGFDVAIRPDNPRYAYAMSQGGNLGYVDMQTGYTRNIKPVHPEGKELRFNWNAGFAQNPFHGCGIYFGSQHLHKSMDCGSSWEVISPDLTTNDSTKQEQYKSGGLTIDDTEAENFTTIIAIAPSAIDENVIWVGTDDGNVQVTRDGGKNWKNVAGNLRGANPGSWIPYIEPGNKAGEAFVVVSDYRRNNWKPYVYHTTDFGTTFRRIVNEKQVEGHALSIVQDPEVSDMLWLGTDHGLYFTIDFGKNWQKWTNGFPAVTTTDLKIHPRDHDLIIGTFGRSAWILDDLRPLREVARTKGEVLKKDFAVFPAPDGYLAEYRSVDGTRFTADAHFRGQNKSGVPYVTCWIKPGGEDKETAAESSETAAEESKEETESEEPAETEEKTEDKPKKKSDKVKVVVLSEQGDTVRNFSSKVDTGFVRIYWNMSHNGVRYPSRRTAKPDDDLPSGYFVLPGTYKMICEYNGALDSTSITVHADPRIDISTADRRAQQQTYRDFYGIVEKVNEAWNRLQEAKKTIKVVNEAIGMAPDSLQKDLKKMGKSLQDSIASLEKRFMNPSGMKGIQDDSHTLRRTLFRTSSYIGAQYGPPSQSAQVMIEKSRRETADILEGINSFFAEDFAEYQEKVESLEYSLFKPYEPIKLD